MLSIYTSISLAVPSALAFLAATAHGDTCFNDTKTHGTTAQNATGTVPFPSFLSPYPNEDHTNWTLSIGMAMDNSTSSDPTITTTVWLNTNPVLNLSSPDLPLNGCGFYFVLNATDKPLLSKDPETGSCEGVLPKKCQDQIEAVITPDNLGFYYFDSSNDETSSNFTGMNCTSLYQNLRINSVTADNCQGVIESIKYSPISLFGNESYPGLSSHPGSTCSNNIGNGSPSSAWISQSVVAVDPSDQLKAYRNNVGSSSPVVLVGWPRNAKAEAEITSGIVHRASELVCLTAVNITAGSEKTSNARERANGWHWSAVVATGLVAVTVFSF